MIPQNIVKIIDEIKSKRQHNSSNSCFIQRQFLVKLVDNFLEEKQNEDTSYISTLKEILLCFEIYDEYENQIAENHRDILAENTLLHHKNTQNEKLISDIRNFIKSFGDKFNMGQTFINYIDGVKDKISATENQDIGAMETSVINYIFDNLNSIEHPKTLHINEIPQITHDITFLWKIINKYRVFCTSPEYVSDSQTNKLLVINNELNNFGFTSNLVPQTINNTRANLLDETDNKLSSLHSKRKNDSDSDKANEIDQINIPKKKK